MYIKSQSKQVFKEKKLSKDDVEFEKKAKSILDKAGLQGLEELWGIK